MMPPKPTFREFVASRVNDARARLATCDGRWNCPRAAGQGDRTGDDHLAPARIRQPSSPRPAGRSPPRSDESRTERCMLASAATRGACAPREAPRGQEGRRLAVRSTENSRDRRYPTSFGPRSVTTEQPAKRHGMRDFWSHTAHGDGPRRGGETSARRAGLPGSPACAEDRRAAVGESLRHGRGPSAPRSDASGIPVLVSRGAVVPRRSR
jgi:hypothetical protein